MKFRATVPVRGIISYTINGAAVQDSWKRIWVAFNGSGDDRTLDLTAGEWNTGIDTNGSTGSFSGHVVLKGYSAVILYQ